jgi:hypothetical protein
MSLFNDAQDLATQAADFRREIHGVNQSGTEQKFTSEGMADPLACYYTPIRDRQQLDAAKMEEIHDGIVRIQKTIAAAATPPFVPRLGQVITLLDARLGGGDLTVRFDEFGHSELNPEFVIGVGSQF